MKFFKNIVIYTVACFLFLGSVGFNVFKHICEEDGTLVSYIVQEEDEHCGDVEDFCCEEENTNDCCSHEVDYFQVKLDFFDNMDFPVFLAVSEISLKDYWDYQFIEASIKTIVTNYPNPPPILGRDILIKNQVFII